VHDVLRQAFLSPNFGALATPMPWQAMHVDRTLSFVRLARGGVRALADAMCALWSIAPRARAPPAPLNFAPPAFAM